MCATNTPCRPSPQSRSPTESQTDDGRFHQQHPPHPPAYIYYAPPYPHLNPYGHYPYHPGGFYSPPYCNDIVQESKGGSSWLSILLLIFLLVFIASIVYYWSLSRDSRRRLNARLPTLVQPTQVNLTSGCCVIVVYFYRHASPPTPLIHRRDCYKGIMNS
ncbi:hypothetical protein ANTRET_LOCUS10058 [Anthophora retusa]